MRDSEGQWSPCIFVVAILGNSLEWYSLAIVEGLSDSIAVSLLPPGFGSIGHSLIGVSLVARCIGGLGIGLVGDRRGEARVLKASAIAMGASLIPLSLALPFSSAGWLFSAIFFAVVWFFSSLMLGGQFGASAVLALDKAPWRWRGLCSGLVLASCTFGFANGSIASFVVQNSNIPHGWRIVLGIGGICSIILFSVQLNLFPKEDAVPDRKDIEHSASSSHNFTVAILVSIAWSIPAAISAHWLPNFVGSLDTWNGVDLRLVSALIFWQLTVLLPVGGVVADVFLHGRTLAAGHTSLLVWPLGFWCMLYTTNIASGLIICGLVNFSLSLVGGPLLAWLLAILFFRPSERCRQTVNTWNFCQLVGGIVSFALRDGRHVGVLTVGLCCSVAGMVGLRGLLWGIRLLSDSSVISKAAVYDQPTATTFGNLDEFNDGLDIELEDELVTLTDNRQFTSIDDSSHGMESLRACPQSQMASNELHGDSDIYSGGAGIMDGIDSGDEISFR